jgi:hypothetical protein
MKVDPTAAARAGQAKRGDKTSKAQPGEFSRLLDSVESAEAPRAVLPTPTIDPLAAFGDGAQSNKRRAVKRGHDLLTQLEGLRLALLDGRLPEAQIRDLKRMVDEARGSTDDANLNQLLDEVDLRAQVELAKLGRI